MLHKLDLNGRDSQCEGVKIKTGYDHLVSDERVETIIILISFGHISRLYFFTDIEIHV